MKKKRIIEINARLRAILKAAADEKRALNEAEIAEKKSLEEERQVLLTEVQIESSERFVGAVNGLTANNRALNEAFVNAVSEAMRSRTDIAIAQDRAIVTNDAAGMVPLTIGDIFGPLEKGLIVKDLGCRIQTGLVGDWDYPVVGAVEATINGETADVSATGFDISKVSPKPNRAALVIEVSRTALNQATKLRDIVLFQLSKAAERLINKWVFATANIATGVGGPFVAPTTSQTFSGDVPTFKELMALKGAVKGHGVQPEGVGAFIMNASMQAALEATSRDAGSGRMIIENGRIGEYPVFTTEYCPADTVEFGYFGYLLIGQFANMSITVDPYTKAASNIVRFIMNGDYDVRTPFACAFGVLKKGQVTPDTVSGASSISAGAGAGSNDRTYATSNGSTVTAEVTSENSDWLTVSAQGNVVTFTRTANEGEADRVATVRVKAAVGEAYKDVTVTQAHA